MSFLKTCKQACFPVILVFIQFNLNAQTLIPGTIVVIGWNSTTDIVRFATLANIPSGTVIKITDRGWSQATNAFTTSVTGDGIVTWTTSSLIPEGTVLSLFLGGTGDAQVTTLTNQTTGTSLTSDISFTGFTVADPMGIAGDQILVYQGLDSNPFFIFGMNNSSGTVDGTGWNTSVAITLRDSQLPNSVGSQNALTNGTNAVGMPGAGLQQDNVQYTGPTGITTGAAWLARFSTVSNWTGDNTGAGGSTVGSAILISYALPVSLLSFSAEAKDDDVLLRWTTAAEINFRSYEIESGSDGASFTLLASVEASGATGDKQYSWLDDKAITRTGKLYYRLKLMDNDGRFSYSKTVLVTPGNTTQRILNVSPNPFASQFSIQLNLPKKGGLQIRLTDMNGVATLEKKVTAEKGFSSLTIPALNGVAKGSYLLTVRYEDEVYRYKLVK